MKDMFNMTTRSKYIINIPALKESIPNSSDKYSRVGVSFITVSLLSNKLGAYWFPEKRGGEVTDRKRGRNQGSTSHLLCSITELLTKTILGDRDEDMLFSVIVSRIGIW
jgi:hypothetical protein